MSKLLVDLETLKSNHKKNHAIKIRILGTVLDYNPMGQHILIKSINTLAPNYETVKLSLDLVHLVEPEYSYMGTLIDASCLYDGNKITILTIRILGDEEFTSLQHVIQRLVTIKEKQNTLTNP